MIVVIIAASVPQPDRGTSGQDPETDGITADREIQQCAGEQSVEIGPL